MAVGAKQLHARRYIYYCNFTVEDAVAKENFAKNVRSAPNRRFF